MGQMGYMGMPFLIADIARGGGAPALLQHTTVHLYSMTESLTCYLLSAHLDH